MVSGTRKSVRSADSEQATTRKALFQTYFPRVFAYAHALTDDDAKAKEIVVECFARVFAPAKAFSDGEFPAALFGIAHAICQKLGAQRPELEDDLNARERQIMALVFDAQLSRPQIVSLLGVEDGDIGSILLSGLTKLRLAVTPVPAPAFFRRS
jgi:hypothetical protein